MSKHKESWQEDRQACAQALLNRWWITKENDGAMFQKIKNHYEGLRDWFQEYCGFTLLLTRQFAKLEKVPGEPQAWMGLAQFQQVRDYALFTYCLWYLEGKGENDQFLLTEMVEEIREHLLSQDVTIDWTLYDHRLSMARALKMLKELGVLQVVDGDELDWARNGSEEANVLYEASNLARYVLRRFPQDLPVYNDLKQLTLGVYADTTDGQIKQRRNKVYRRLLQEPAVYDWQWQEDELYYVLTQRRSILDQLEKNFGLVGQRYREGLIFFYPETSGESLLFPTAKASSDLALLLGGELRRLLAADGSGLWLDEQGRVTLTWVDLERIVLKLRERYQNYWGKQHRNATTRQLAQELIDHLTEWGLAGKAGDKELWIYPGLARWNGDYDNFETEAEG